MPINTALSDLEDLIAALQDVFRWRKRRRITFEYVLLAGVNDTPEDARRLVRLLDGIKRKVNLLPLNEAAGHSVHAAVGRARQRVRAASSPTAASASRCARAAAATSAPPAVSSSSKVRTPSTGRRLAERIARTSEEGGAGVEGAEGLAGCLESPEQQRRDLVQVVTPHRPFVAALGHPIRVLDALSRSALPSTS